MKNLTLVVSVLVLLTSLKAQAMGPADYDALSMKEFELEDAADQVHETQAMGATAYVEAQHQEQAAHVHGTAVKKQRVQKQSALARAQATVKMYEGRRKAAKAKLLADKKESVALAKEIKRLNGIVAAAQQHMRDTERDVVLSRQRLAVEKHRHAKLIAQEAQLKRIDNRLQNESDRLMMQLEDAKAENELVTEKVKVGKESVSYHVQIRHHAPRAPASVKLPPETTEANLDAYANTQTH